MTALWTNIKPISSSPCSPLTSDCSVNQHKTYLITTLATPIWLFCGPTQNLSHHICHSHLTALWTNTKPISSPHLPLPSDCSVDQHKTCLITFVTPIWLLCGRTQNLSHHHTCHSHLTVLWTNTNHVSSPHLPLPSDCSVDQQKTCHSHLTSLWTKTTPISLSPHLLLPSMLRPYSLWYPQNSRPYSKASSCAHHGIHKPLGHTHQW